MTIKTRLNSEHLVTTRVRGLTNLGHLIEAVLAPVDSPACSRYWWQLILLEDTLIIYHVPGVGLKVAHAAKETIQFKRGGAIAIVANTLPSRRMCDRFATLLRGDIVPVTVFDDESSARKWMAIHMHCAHFDSTTMRVPRPRPTPGPVVKALDSGAGIRSFNRTQA